MLQTVRWMRQFNRSSGVPNVLIFRKRLVEKGAADLGWLPMNEPANSMPLWFGLSLFFLGALIGWSLRFISMRDRLMREAMASKADLPKFDEFAADMRKTDALLQASEAETDLALLTWLESEKIADATTLMIHKLGSFYHKWKSTPMDAVPSDIQDALSRIERVARDYKSVRSVLAYKPKGELPC